MKRKGKIILSIVLVLILLVPIPMRYKDGGSICFRAILYEITKYHRLDHDSVTGFRDGLKIRIFGIPIYDSFKEN